MQPPKTNAHSTLKGTAMKSKDTNCKNTNSCRLNKVGGQAVLEGVMMKAGTHAVTTCRKADGTLTVTDDSFCSIRKKYKILNLPLVRGVVNFAEMMALSVKTLGASAEALDLDNTEEPSRFEKWLAEKLKVRLTDLVMVISVILGLLLSVGLFLLLPIWITAGINALISLFGGEAMGAVLTASVEGVIKMAIFVLYLSLTSLVPDIKRTFMYHGAEHKSIACFEAGEELTPENAAKHTRLHPRCGTSFMFFMILIGVFVGIIIKSVIPGLQTWLYTVIRLLILPLVVGIGYEIIMLAGKHDNPLTRALSAPGLLMQKITTKEPTLDMLEVAIVSIKCALRDDFPEFMEFYKTRGWINESTGEDTPPVIAEGAEAEGKDDGTESKNTDQIGKIADRQESETIAEQEAKMVDINITKDANTDPRVDFSPDLREEESRKDEA